MTAIRLGMLFLALGVSLLIAGGLDRADDDLLHIAAVGCIVFGAVAICIATEAKSNGVPPRREASTRPRSDPRD